MSFRKVIFWLHLMAGLTAGVIILIMSLTGILLAYQRQITAWADGDNSVEQQPSAFRLSLEKLIKEAQAAQPDHPAVTSVMTSSMPTAPVAVSFGPERTVFLNPYMGEIVGEGSRTARKFMQTVTDIHRWMAMPELRRDMGKGITGGATFVFFLLVTSGLYLWFPRRWDKKSLAMSYKLVGGLSAKVRLWNWHNAIGFWCMPFLFFITLTGIIMSYSWANNLLFRMTGNVPPLRNDQGLGTKGAALAKKRHEGDRDDSHNHGEVRAVVKLDQLNTCYAQATILVPDWQIITLRISPSPAAPLILQVSTDASGRFTGRTQLTFSQSTGELLTNEPYKTSNLGKKLRSWARYVHTGEAGGLLGQTIALLASVGAVILVCTGFALAWRRFSDRFLSRAKAAPSSAAKELSC